MVWCVVSGIWGKWEGEAARTATADGSERTKPVPPASDCTRIDSEFDIKMRSSRPSVVTNSLMRVSMDMLARCPGEKQTTSTRKTNAITAQYMATVEGKHQAHFRIAESRSRRKVFLRLRKFGKYREPRRDFEYAAGA